MVRFDQPCYAARGAVEYFREHMAVGDYLTQHGRSEMTWFGAGAQRLGLSGQCDLAAFSALCAGRHPVTREKLMVRDKGAARRVCYFGQISPPKDVSIACLVGGDARIAGWWREAVDETLHEMEAVAATRVRRGGRNADRGTGNVIAALVTHDANRALDPQLHTHLCFMNLTWDSTEQRWKGLQASGFYRHQAFFREVCYNRLAIRLRAAGYEIEPRRKIGFTLKGLPPELRDIFSKRRNAIVEAARAAGAGTQDELQRIALQTRARKSNATAESLRRGWLEQCGSSAAALRALVSQATGRSTPLTIIAPDALASAEAHVFEQKSVVDERALLREALTFGRGQVSLAELRHSLQRCEEKGTLVRAGEGIASAEGLRAEKELVGRAFASHDLHPPLGRAIVRSGLGTDQVAAVKGLLECRSGMAILQGDAGSGKTTALREVVAGVTAAGSNVVGCAPSSAATAVLRSELSLATETLQRLLVDERLQREIHGAVILVDEAGLISVREMRDLFRLAEHNSHRLVLVGDIKQHHSVEAGDALRALQQYARVPTFRLTEIRRQRHPTYRRAVELMAQGDAFRSLALFKRLGSAHEHPASTLWPAAAADFVRTIQSGKTCLAISPVWSEIHTFTAAVRTELRHAGLISPDETTFAVVHSLKWTREEKRHAAHYQAGDVITFFRPYGPWSKFDTVQVLRRENRQLVVKRLDESLPETRFDPRRTGAFDVGLVGNIRVAAGDRLLMRANLPQHHLRNGDIVEVSEISANHGIRLRDGRSIPPWFREFSHGYATTSHAAQGRTVDRGILLIGKEGILAANLKQCYVSNSRFRESQAIYTTDWRAARAAMMRPADRLLALEMPSVTGRNALPAIAPAARIAATTARAA